MASKKWPVPARIAAVAAIPLMGIGIGMTAAQASSNHSRGLIKIGGPICRVLHGNQKPDYKMCRPRPSEVQK